MIPIAWGNWTVVRMPKTRSWLITVALLASSISSCASLDKIRQDSEFVLAVILRTGATAYQAFYTPAARIFAPVPLRIALQTPADTFVAFAEACSTSDGCRRLNEELRKQVPQEPDNVALSESKPFIVTFLHALVRAPSSVPTFAIDVIRFVCGAPGKKPDGCELLLHHESLQQVSPASEQ